jgi:hypothetical protein
MVNLIFVHCNYHFICTSEIEIRAVAFLKDQLPRNFTEVRVSVRNKILISLDSVLLLQTFFITAYERHTWYKIV